MYDHGFMDNTNRQAVKNWLNSQTSDASLTSKWLPPWRIHETMVVHMTWVWTFFNNYSNHPRMCVLSTLCGNVDKHSPFDIYISIYIYLYISISLSIYIYGRMHIYLHMRIARYLNLHGRQIFAPSFIPPLLHFFILLLFLFFPRTFSWQLKLLWLTEVNWDLGIDK